MEIKPWQINELISQHTDVSLSELIPLVLAGKAYDCPQCTTSGLIPDPDNPASLISCPTCNGYGKTTYEYEAVVIPSAITYNVKTGGGLTQLGTPTGLALTASTGQVMANCDDVTNATQYRFQIATENTFAAPVQDSLAATSNITFSGLMDGTTYYVRAMAVASGYDNSNWSTIQSIIPPGE